MAERQTKTRLAGAYLSSFGATRTFAVVAPMLDGPSDWIVLESPAPPAGAAALTLVRARIEAISQLVKDHCSSRKCGKAVSRGLGALLRAGSVDRSVSGRDVTLGLIAAATVPDDNRTLLQDVANAASKGALDERTASRLRLLGRLYSGQRPTKTLSPSVIALWADTCPRMEGWDQLASARGALVEAYAWIFRGCSSSGGPSHTEEPARVSAPPMLMLTGRGDTIVPESMQDSWLHLGLPISHRYGRYHFWDDSATSAATSRWIKDRETS